MVTPILSLRSGSCGNRWNYLSQEVGLGSASCSDWLVRSSQTGQILLQSYLSIYICMYAYIYIYIYYMFICLFVCSPHHCEGFSLTVALRPRSFFPSVRPCLLPPVFTTYNSTPHNTHSRRNITQHTHSQHTPQQYTTQHTHNTHNRHNITKSTHTQHTPQQHTTQHMHNATKC